MSKLRLRRIQAEAPDAPRELAVLRSQLSLQADIVSPRGRQLTLDVFGQELTPAQTVERICSDVRQRGLSAVLDYTEKFDKVRLTPSTVRVTANELAAAHRAASPEFLAAIRRIRQRVLAFQMGILHSDAVLNVPGSYDLTLRYRPMRRVGVCVPGGAAAYPSTLLMTVCPAEAAGVKEIVVVMPPTPNGAYNPTLLATCRELGVSEVYRVGGAQAVAALAYGCNEISPVQMIVGPGNIFVTLAKKYVFGQVAIDCLAGPSEVVVLADDSASPEFVASDLIAQAEHDPGSSVLITWHEPLVSQVEEAMERQLARLERGGLAQACLERFGAAIVTRDAAQAVEWANQMGPEHLQVAAKNADRLVEKIDNAGAIFVGQYSPVALGDYAAGPSHVLPTGGTARFASGLSAVDFLRRGSVIHFTPRGLESIADDVELLARIEGLTGHAASVSVRRP